MQSLLIKIFGKDVCGIGSPEHLDQLDLLVVDLALDPKVLTIKVSQLAEAAPPGNADCHSSVGVNPKIDSFARSAYNDLRPKAWESPLPMPRTLAPPDDSDKVV